MPVGKYPTFDACVTDHQSKGHDVESARKICGTIEKNMGDESWDMSDCMKFFTKLELSEGEFDPDAEFEIITTAKQTDPRYGDFQFKKADLEQMAKNFNDDVVGVEIAVDLNHDEDGIALAWIVPGSMRVADSKKLPGECSVYAKFYRYTPKGQDLMQTGAVRYFSIELKQAFTKFVGNVKKTFNNVIRGLALTNRPVVKDMSPTFSDQSKISNNQILMKKLADLHQSLMAKGKITKEEFQSFSDLADETREGEGVEPAKVDEMVAEVKTVVETDEEKTARETAETKAKAEVEAAEAKALAEAADKAAAEALANGKSDKTTFSESDLAVFLSDALKIALKEPMQAINKKLAEFRTGKIAARVKELCLSDSKSVGFKSGAKDGIVEFVKTLNDEQVEMYFKLHEGVVASVDTEEHGADGEGEKTPSDVEAVLSELNKEVSALAEKEKISESEAFKKVLSSGSDLAKKALKLEEKRYESMRE